MNAMLDSLKQRIDQIKDQKTKEEQARHDEEKLKQDLENELRHENQNENRLGTI